MRNPNGAGCIKKLAGNRRRPYAFAISEHGKQKIIAYFANYSDALECQAQWVRQHDIFSPVRYTNMREMPKFTLVPTFGECFRAWESAHVARYQPSKSSIASYHNAYTKCRELLNRPVDRIAWADLQGLIDRMQAQGLSYSSKKKVKNICSMVLDYAVAMQYIEHNYAALVDIGKNLKPRPHRPFTEEEITTLWENQAEPGADVVLMLIYTGMRVNELLQMERRHVDIARRFFHVVKSKTAAGVRYIPIHHRIFPLAVRRIASGTQYVIEDARGHPYSYSRFTQCWDSLMTHLGMEHKTHDCRHTMASRLDTAGANETARRRILGHAQQTVTEGYTHKSIEELRENVELLA